MSTIAYGALTRKREQAHPGLSSTAAPPGIGFWIDTFAAIVPAEILLVQAALLSLTSLKTRDVPYGNAVVTLTNPGVLRAAFVMLLVAGPILYVLGHVVPIGIKQWHGGDWFRMAIPALAFLAWNLMQRGSALDALVPELDDSTRYVAAAVIGVGLVAAAIFLAWRASERKPGPASRDDGAAQQDKLPVGA
jgi:hypothetical protein